MNARGNGARRFALGERLGVPWLHSTCGACPACRRDDENLCDGARFTGYHVDGGYATHAVVPEAFAPAGSVIPLALARLRKGGTLALAGIHIDRIPEMPYSLLYGERTLRSVTASTRRDAETLLALAARIPIKTEVEEFPLEKANAALQRLKASRISGAGVLRIAP